MPSVLLWACLAENLFLFAAQKNLRIFLSCFFTGRGRDGKRHLLLSACGRRAATSDWRNPKKRLRDLHAEQAGISSFLGVEPTALGLSAYPLLEYALHRKQCTKRRAAQGTRGCWEPQPGPLKKSPLGSFLPPAGGRVPSIPRTGCMKKSLILRSGILFMTRTGIEPMLQP